MTDYARIDSMGRELYAIIQSEGLPPEQAELLRQAQLALFGVIALRESDAVDDRLIAATGMTLHEVRVKLGIDE